MESISPCLQVGLMLVSIVLPLASAQPLDFFSNFTISNPVPRWGYPDPTADEEYVTIRNSYRLTPAALTSSYIYSFLENGSLVAWNWRQRGNLTWQSEIVPGAATYPPVLVTDTATFGGLEPDVVFFLNPNNSRIYAFAPIAGISNAQPLWVSNFKCSTSGASQKQQWLTVNSAAGFIIAQCNHNLAVADMLTGKLHITIKNKTLDPTLPATLLTAHTLAQPRDNKVHALSLKTPGIIPYTAHVPDPSYSVNAVVSGGSIFATTGANSSTLYFFKTGSGKLLGNITLDINATNLPDASNFTVLPRPVIHKGILYCIVTGLVIDPFGELPPMAYYVLTAVDVSNASAPYVRWQTQEPQQGSPPPQPIVLSEYMVYVTLTSKHKYIGYYRATGEQAWYNAPPIGAWPRGLGDAALGAVAYCCDHLFVTGYPLPPNNASAYGAPTSTGIEYVPIVYPDGILTPTEECHCTP